MPPYRVRCHFRIRALLIDDALVGKAWTIASGERPVRVIFPLREAIPDESLFWEQALLKPDMFPSDPEPAHDPTLVEARVGIVPVYPSPLARVDVVRIEVTGPLAIGHSNDSFEARAPVAEAVEFGASVLQRLLDWERVRGRQYWLGISGDGLVPLGAAEVVDLETNTRLPFGVRVAGGAGVAPQTNLGRLAREDLLYWTTSAQPTQPLGDRLLMDAAFYAWSAQPADPVRALLIAAVACEVKAKEALLQRAHPAARPALELLVKKLRPTVSLFDTGADVTVGRSLKKENRDLYNGIARLFDRRNDVAHHGKEPRGEETSDAIRAALEAFKWLERLPWPPSKARS